MVEGLFLEANNTHFTTPFFSTIIHFQGSDVLFEGNDADGFLYAIVSPLTQSASTPIPKHGFLAGIQEWVVGGGDTTEPRSLYMGISILSSRDSTAGAIRFQGRPESPTVIQDFSGVAASIGTSIGGSNFTINGLALPTYGDGDVLAGWLTISGAATSANNGKFPVYVPAGNTASSLVITNASANPSDANNGSIHWSYSPSFTISLYQTESFGPKVFDFSTITNITHATSVLLSAAGWTECRASTVLVREQVPRDLLGWGGSSHHSLRSSAAGPRGRRARPDQPAV